VGLVKQITNHWHGKGNVETANLEQLALIAGPDEPFHIVDQYQPQEAEEQAGMDYEDTFVPKVIISLLNQTVLLGLWHHQLMMPKYLCEII